MYMLDFKHQGFDLRTEDAFVNPALINISITDIVFGMYKNSTPHAIRALHLSCSDHGLFCDL